MKTILPAIRLILISFILSFIFISCKAKTSDLEIFLNRFEIQYEQISIELGTAYWNFYSGETEANLLAPKINSMLY